MFWQLIWFQGQLMQWYSDSVPWAPGAPRSPSETQPRQLLRKSGQEGAPAALWPTHPPFCFQLVSVFIFLTCCKLFIWRRNLEIDDLCNISRLKSQYPLSVPCGRLRAAEFFRQRLQGCAGLFCFVFLLPVVMLCAFQGICLFSNI